MIATEPGAQGLLPALQALWRELPGLISDRVELFSLELQRAMRSLSQALVLVVAAAILGVTAWLALWAIAVQLLVMAGLHWLLALGLALLLNLGAAAWALLRARALFELVSLPATRRHLTLGPTVKAAPDVPSHGPEPEPRERATVH